MSNIFREMYKSKLTTPEEAVKVVKSGDTLGVSLGLNDPPALSAALCDRYQELENVRIIQSLGMFPRAYMNDPKMKGHFFHHSTFFGAAARDGGKIGLSDFDASHMSTAGPVGVKNHHINVFWTTVSAMDDRGFMSTGAGCVLEKDFIKAADIVIVEVNENLPKIMGETIIHIRDVDIIVENTVPLFQLPVTEPSEKDKLIGKYVAELVEDESTIQLGIGGIPNAVGLELFDKRDLGIHTEMLCDSMVDLYYAGAVTNRKKTYYPGRFTAVFALGTQKLYDFVDNNPGVYILPSTVAADEAIIGLNHKQVSVNTCLMVDLAGQVCSESFGPIQYSGMGGAHDFSRGVRRSKGGKAIMALYSTAKNDTVSTVNSVLPLGSYVTVPRGDVMYVVTEYGIAKLDGKTRSERARELIAVAHPNFRKELEQEAYKYGILV